jgi:tripartite-type tricarboxylate transporter receptor subunit TctC
MIHATTPRRPREIELTAAEHVRRLNARAKRLRLVMFAAVALATTLTAIAPVRAEADWPKRPIKIVVPAPPGSSTDLLARVLSDQLPKVLGQPVLVDNRPGAATNIGSEYVARQPNDGYTILLTQNTLVTNVHFFSKLSFDPLKDFEPISLIGTTPLVLTVNANSGIKSTKDLVDAARSRKMVFGSPGIGSPQHLATVLLASSIGVQMTHVPYKGSAPVAVALVGGEVAMTISVVSAVLPHIQSGRLRAIGLSDERRSSLVPGVPPISETVSGVVLEAWYAVFAPAGTPRPIIDRLNTEINRILKDPEIAKSRLAPAGVEPSGSTPEHLRQVMLVDLEKYRKIVKDAGIQPQ